MSIRTLLWIAVGALPGALVYLLGWYWWAAPVAYGFGVFIGRVTRYDEFMALIEKARQP